MDNRIRTLGIGTLILILSLYVVGIVPHGTIERRHGIDSISWEDFLIAGPPEK